MGKYSRRNFIKAGVALGTMPLIAGSGGQDPEAMKEKGGKAVKAVTETNHINVVEGEFIYEKPRVRVRPGDTIRWVYPEHPMSIHFPGIVPVSQSSYQAGPDGVISMTIPEKTTLFGCFKYFIAVYDAATRKILTDDPDIIIDPKGGRGKG